jgi:O-acetyl-ADP-ribose deacetylase (regulator of RNase III)
MSTLVAEHILPSGQNLRLFHGDLTQENVDVIVNAANAHLKHGGGLAGAIVRAGGDIIQEESNTWVQKHGPISQTEPAITSSGALPCGHIIHAVGPRWGEGDEDAKLQAAVRGALSLADRKNMKTIAFPAISTGIFGFPKERGADVILDTITEFCGQHPEASMQEIRITLIETPSVHVFSVAFSARWPDSVLQP